MIKVAKKGKEKKKKMNKFNQKACSKPSLSILKTNHAIHYLHVNSPFKFKIKMQGQISGSLHV